MHSLSCPKKVYRGRQNLHFTAVKNRVEIDDWTFSKSGPVWCFPSPVHIIQPPNTDLKKTICKEINRKLILDSCYHWLPLIPNYYSEVRNHFYGTFTVKVKLDDRCFFMPNDHIAHHDRIWELERDLCDHLIST